MADRWALAHNLSDTPIAVDEEGRSLGGGEWGAVDASALTSAAAGSDSVVIFDKLPTGDDMSPAVTAAIDEVREANREAKAPKSDAAEATTASAASPSPKRGS